MVNRAGQSPSLFLFPSIYYSLCNWQFYAVFVAGKRGDRKKIYFFDRWGGEWCILITETGNNFFGEVQNEDYRVLGQVGGGIRT